MASLTGIVGGGVLPQPPGPPAPPALPLPRMYYIDPTGADTKDPTVVRFKGRYWMYYSVGNPPNGGAGGGGMKGWTIGIATSTNLRDWTFAGRMTPTTPPEMNGFCAPGAIVLDDRLHLFYQSYGGGPKDAILHATSEDGLSFTRDMTSPVFRPTGEWTNGRAIDAEAFVVEGGLHLYFATRDPAGAIQMVGAASTPLRVRGAISDLSQPRWTQRTTAIEQAFRPTVPTPRDKPDLDLKWEQKCIEAPTLMKHKGLYYLFYAGAYNNAPQQIGVAVSEDGLRFRRLNNGQPILGPGPRGSWNASETGHPGAFQDADGRDYLFFQGDNTPDKVKWHLSMAPVRWQVDPAGGPDLPQLELERR